MTRMLLFLLLMMAGAQGAWAGITSLPYSTDFSSGIEPFENTIGTTVETTSTANISSVLHVYNATATATFTGGYTLRSTEKVTISFTAYHGWNSYDRSSTIAVKNTSGETLVSYTYNQNSAQVTDVTLGGSTADEFSAFSGISKYNETKNANGLNGNGKPYVNTAGYNPTITMTVSGSGLVTFSFVCSGRSISQSYTAVLDDRAINLGSIVITDADDGHSGDQSDRSICIDNLSITSQYYSNDYETSTVDWTTATGGRYTPTIYTDATTGNKYMAVAQDQRYNNGTTLTNNVINGSARAGENFTLSFDMKIGRSNRNQKVTKFTIFDAANQELFYLADEGTTDNKWKLGVYGASESEITLSGTGTSTATDGTALDDLTWYHFNLTYDASNSTKVLYITITDLDGTHTYWRGGTGTTSLGGLSKMTFATLRHYANLAFDNLLVTTLAQTSFSVSGKEETYTITGTGDLPQKDEGSTVTIEYGDTWQVQQTATSGNTVGAYCLDGNIEGKWSQAWAAYHSALTATSKPTVGTFYKFTPKFNGTLSISGWVNDVNNITLQKESDGTVVGIIPATDLTANTLFSSKTVKDASNTSNDFELQADTEYYLYASTYATANGNGTETYPTLFLSGFTFTQSGMNREIKVSDLLYTGSTPATSNALSRTIPGFTLSYSGDDAVQTTSDGSGLTISNGGSMTVTLRQNSHDATIKSITLYVSEVTSATVNSTSITTTGKQAFTNSPATDNMTLSCTKGSLTITGISVEYNSDDSDYESAWLDETKSTPAISFNNSHIMHVAGDGLAFVNNAAYSEPRSFAGPLTYTSSNTNIATINEDGTNGQLLKSESATITATFAATDYFNSASATYTVDNILHNGEKYTRTVNDNYTLRIDAYAETAESALTLTGANDASLSFGTTSTKRLSNTNSTTLILTNNSSNNITIEALKVYTHNVKAYLYYAGQEEDYSMQVQFQGFASGAITGFRVLDIGDPLEPIDLTDAYSLKEDANYVWNNGSHVISSSHLGNGENFNASTGTFTASGKNTIGENETETLPTITHLLKKKTGTANGYDDEYNAIANIYLATPTDEDGDGTNDTYKKWNMTASVTGNGQLDDSRWTWNYHGYYQTSMSEYLPVIDNSGTSTTLAGNEGVLVKGDLRYYVGTNGLRLNLTQVNSRLKFPVKKGMEVKIEMSSASADIEHIISNVTDVAGNATNKLYTEYAGETVTAYYLAENDGAVELQSLDKTGSYVKSITLQTPHLHFNEEIVTVQASNSSYTVINLPYNASSGANLTYTIEGEYSLPATYNGDGAATAAGSIATIDSSTGTVTVTGTEGYAIINVVDNNATGVQPKKGSYRLYVINFQFDPKQYNSTTDVDNDDISDEPDLNLSSSEAIAQGGEALFSVRPVGYDKVVQPVTYTMTYYEGTPRGRLTQTTKTDPRQTTYEMSAYSAGTIRVTATTGRVSTYCDVVISGGNNFAEIAPVTRLEDLSTETGQYYFLNELPSGFGTTGTTTYIVDKSGDISCDRVTTISQNDAESVTHYYAKISNITGTGGALRVTATNTYTDNKGTTEDTSDDEVVTRTATFILTVAYPASTGHKWDFYRMKHYTHDATTEYGLYIGELGNLITESTISNMTISSHSATQRMTSTSWNAAWTTVDTKWNRIYRKGEEQPRWAYHFSTKGDNAFIIEETAGLIIETGQNGFYTDNPHQPDEFAYNHIGLYNNATVTIPQLKKGDYISLNLCRVIPNSGAILSATNVNDLAGNTVDHTFTITHSQNDYQSGGLPVTDSNGARIIPGYYTFRAAADGDVSFTLADEGYLDILSIEIYNSGYATPSGSKRDSDNDYIYTMTDIVTDETYKTPPAIFLLDKGETEEVTLAICHHMMSTGVGPAEYVLLSQRGNLNATLENVEWISNGGAYYNKGHIDVEGGYGKMNIRMNNYTAEGRYLIGYTPTYSLTVGQKPHQDYPFTWNFKNISGGAVKGRSNNAYNSISTDYLTWTYLGYETYQLNTSTAGGSLYVPGAVLVTDARSLGERGEASTLNAAGYGCDELNGLGFSGQFTFKLAQQGSTANDAPTYTTENPWNQGTANSLLEYSFNYTSGSDADNAYTAQSVYDSVNDKTTWTPADLTAGDGKVMFGSPGKREAPASGVTITSGANFVYKMDGGNSKNVLLMPQRPLKNGDQITLNGYSSASVQESGFSFYAAANDASANDLVTIYWPEGTAANTETTLTYTVTAGDGLSGRSEVYLFRANKAKTVYLTSIAIAGTDTSAPTAYERALTCNGSVTVTIPDLVAGHYVYIKSSNKPTTPESLTEVTESNKETYGHDADTGVYEYIVNNAGNADVTFSDGTKIYAIGVTDILKQLKRVGDGDAWATESRNHAIDYTQTDTFTVNNIVANTVSAKSYTTQKVIVQLNEQTYALPAETGLVLKRKLAYKAGDDDGNGVTMTAEQASTATTNAATDFAKAKGGDQVPLFYPPHSATVLSSNTVGFGGSQGNLLYRNLADTTFTTETKTIGTTEYVPFIFAYKYMKWQKVNEGTAAPTNSTAFLEGTVPVFYRLHVYDNTEAGALSSSEATLNTLGANKAYMLIRSGNVPEALWNSSGGGAKGYIGISGISDFEWIEDNTVKAINSGTYNMQGQKMNDNGPLPAGLYIVNGRKVVVR